MMIVFVAALTILVAGGMLAFIGSVFDREAKWRAAAAFSLCMVIAGGIGVALTGLIELWIVVLKN